MANQGINWNSYLEIASITDVGMRRASNQDNYAVDVAGSLEKWRERGHLFMVADGMGAHAAGELASEIACEKIPQLYAKYTEVSAPEALKKSVIETNGVINRKGQANEEFFNMGTTCSVLTLLSQGAVIAHIGDSRIYRLRDNLLEQLTFDHSLVWEMQHSGQLSADDAEANLVPKNVITRSLGPYPDVKVDLEGPFPVEMGDTFLLCSDGLTGLVNDDELGSILGNLKPQEAVQVLTDLTNLRGGPDNITIVVVKVIREELTTARTASKPITLGTKKTTGGVSPISLACLAAAVVATIVFGIIGGALAAAIPGAIALICLVWIAISAGGLTGGGTVVGSHQRFGKGPYVRVNCASGDEVVDKLRAMTGELKEAAESSNRVNLKTMNALLDKADVAAREGDTANAIKYYSRSISTMMDELRKSAQHRATDSSVDL